MFGEIKPEGEKQTTYGFALMWNTEEENED